MKELGTPHLEEVKPSVRVLRSGKVLVYLRIDNPIKGKEIHQVWLKAAFDVKRRHLLRSCFLNPFRTAEAKRKRMNGKQKKSTKLFKTKKKYTAPTLSINNLNHIFSLTNNKLKLNSVKQKHILA